MILFILILVGLGLRLWQLGESPYWMDEGFSIATAQQWLLGDWWIRSPLYHFVLGLVGSTSDWNIYLLRSLSVVAGSVVVLVGYQVAKRWFNPITARLFSFLLATATLEIAWSRQVRMYIVLQLFFWLALYAYYQWRQHQLHWAWPLCYAMAAITSHEFGWFVLVIYAWYEILQRFKRTHILFVLISLLVTYITYHLVFSAAPYINYWWQYWYWLVVNYGLLLPLAVLGVATHRQYAKLLNWLIVIWLGWLGCLSFIVPLLQYRYLMMTFPIILLLAGLGLAWLWQQRWIGKCAVFVCIGICLWQQQLTIWPRGNYQLESDAPNVPFAYKSFTPQPNFTAAYQFVQQYQMTYPDAIVIDAYPTLHQLYLGTLPTAAVFINLTGTSYVATPVQERYTGVQYATIQQLRQWQGTHPVLLVVDDFAEYRLDPTIKPLLDTGTVIWQQSNGAWSGLIIYQLGTSE